jgi:hypothetical protein
VGTTTSQGSYTGVASLKPYGQLRGLQLEFDVSDHAGLATRPLLTMRLGVQGTVGPIGG